MLRSGYGVTFQFGGQDAWCTSPEGLEDWISIRSRTQMDIVDTERESNYFIDQGHHLSSSSDQGVHSVLNHHRSQMPVRKQAVDRLLKLLAEEGTPRLGEGNRQEGKAASRLRELETHLLSDKQSYWLVEDVRITPGRIADGGGRGNGIPGAPGGNGGRPKVHHE